MNEHGGPDPLFPVIRLQKMLAPVTCQTQQNCLPTN